jgi:hypothetical protein
MKNVSCLLLLFISCSFASGNMEKEFHIDTNMIFQDNNKYVKLLKTYSFDNSVIDINRCNEDTIVLLRRKIKNSMDISYEETYKLEHEKLIKSHTKEIDPSIYSNMRLEIENSLTDLFIKYKNIDQVTLNKEEINQLKKFIENK